MGGGVLLVLALLVLTPNVIGDGLTGFQYTNFSHIQGLELVGNAFPTEGIMNLCQSGSVPLCTSAVWYEYPMQVHGFETTFVYATTNNSKTINARRDGIAFVIQNEGPNVIGVGGNGIGYGDPGVGRGNKGITKCIAIEFDSFPDPILHDPNAFHVSVHTSSKGGPNNADEQYSIWSAVLPSFIFSSQMAIKIRYEPIGATLGTLTIWLKDFELPSFNLPLNDYVTLDPTQGSAYVGFTGGSTPGNTSFPPETISVLSWQFQFLGAIKPSNSIVFGLDYTVAGQILTFYLQTVDQYGFNMTTDSIAASNLTLVVNTTELNGNLIRNTIAYSGMGLYKLTVNCTVSGPATVQASLAGSPFGNSSFILLVVPASPSAGTSFAFGVPAWVVAGSLATFYVRLRDVFANNITANVNMPLTATITSWLGHAQAIPFTFDRVTGLRVGSFNITSCGIFHLQISISGTPIVNGSHTVIIVPAAIDPRTSQP